MQQAQQVEAVENFGDLKKEVTNLKSQVDKLSKNMLSLMNHLGVQHR